MKKNTAIKLICTTLIFSSVIAAAQDGKQEDFFDKDIVKKGIESNEEKADGNLFEKKEPLVPSLEEDTTTVDDPGIKIQKLILIVSLEPYNHFKQYMDYLKTILVKYKNMPFGGVMVIGMPPKDENGDGDFTFFDSITLPTLPNIDALNAAKSDKEKYQEQLQGQVMTAALNNVESARAMEIVMSLRFMPTMPSYIPAKNSPSWVVQTATEDVILLDGVENLQRFLNRKGELVNTDLLQDRPVPKELVVSEER